MMSHNLEDKCDVCQSWISHNSSRDPLNFKGKCGTILCLSKPYNLGTQQEIRFSHTLDASIGHLYLVLSYSKGVSSC